MKTGLISIFKTHLSKNHSFKIIPLLIILLSIGSIVVLNSKSLIAQTIVGTIDLGVELEDGFGSFDMEINTATNQIYVVDVENDNVIVVDGATNTIKETIKVENLWVGSGIGVNSKTNRIYVPTIEFLDFPENKAVSQISSFILPQESGVTVIDGFTNQIIDTIEVPPNPGTVKVNSETGFIYITGFESIFVIDGLTNDVIADIDVGGNVFDIGVNLVTNLIYIGGAGLAGAIGIMDGLTNQVTLSIVSNGEPLGIGVNSTTNLIYLGSTVNEINVIDGLTNKVISIIKIDNDLDPHISRGVVIEANPSTNHIYIDNFVIDGLTNEVIITFDVVGKIAINPKTNLVYIVDSFGEITVVKDIEVEDLLLDANFFTNKIEGNKPLTIEFTDLSLGNPITWQWDFGDGETSDEQNPIHTYINEGVFTVSLTVTDDNSGADTEIREDLISVVILNADFSAEPTIGPAPLTVNFSYKVKGTIDTSFWDFGDGVSEESAGGVVDSLFFNSGNSEIFNCIGTSHEYLNEGVFTVSHTITGPGIPGTSTVVKESLITVTPPLPVADFSVGTTNGVVPLSVKFTDESTGTFDTWLWDFGDGETSNEQNPTHVYGEGIFTVSLTVTGTEGSDTKIKEDLVSTTTAIVITTIDIGEAESDNSVNSTGVDVNPITNHIYVADINSNNLIVINGNNNSVSNSIELGTRPFGLAVNTITNRIYTANFDSNNIRVVDGDTDTIIATIDVEDSPRGVTVNSLTNRIYAANLGSNNVSVIDGNSNAVINTIEVGDDPVGIAVNPDTNLIYVTNASGNNITVINGETNSVVESINVDNTPREITLNSKTNRIYVVNESSDNISVIDGVTNTVIETIAVGDSPRGIAVNLTTNRIYVANNSSDNISVIDGLSNKIIGVIETGEKPKFIGINSTTNSIYITNSLSANLTVLQDNGGVSRPSSLVVNPVIAGKSIALKRATVSLSDQNGRPIPDLTVNAVASGNGAKVVPSSAKTDTDGIVRFRYKFGFITENGEIIFNAEGLNATITQK